jgi:hypothetical protein
MATLNVGHLLSLRWKTEQRGCGEARVAGILNALRSLLKFCRQVLRLLAPDPQQVRVPRISKRDVVYLTKEEREQFLDAIIRSGECWEEVPLCPAALPGSGGGAPRDGRQDFRDPLS